MALKHIFPHMLAKMNHTYINHHLQPNWNNFSLVDHSKATRTTDKQLPMSLNVCKAYLHHNTVNMMMTATNTSVVPERHLCHKCLGGGFSPFLSCLHHIIKIISQGLMTAQWRLWLSLKCKQLEGQTSTFSQHELTVCFWLHGGQAALF